MGHASRKNRQSKKTKTKTKTKTKKGGKFIFAGTSGCGFSNPPLKCVDELTRRNNKFMTKLMDKQSAEAEIEITPFLYGIDPAQKYFLYPQKLCTLDKEDIKPSDEIEKCTGYSNDKYNQLIINTYGGKDLNKIRFAYEEYISFFNSLTNLFDGLELLHANHYIHADVKPPNIVMLHKYPNKIHTRFIDFGLTTNTSPADFRTSKKAYILATPYVYWPFDLIYLFQNNYDTRKKYIESDLREWYIRQSRNQNSLPQSSYWKEDGSKLYNVEDVENIIKRIDYNNYPFNKIDIFSLGQTLGELYTEIIGHRIITKEGTPITEYWKLDPTVPEYDKFIEWNEKVSKNISIPLNHLIYDMIHIDPDIRPDAKTAGERYKKILVDINELFTVDNLINYCVVVNNHVPQKYNIPSTEENANDYNGNHSNNANGSELKND